MYFWYWDGPRRLNKSTGEILKWRAKQEAEKFLAKKKGHATDVTLRQYADPFYVWDSCPHIRRLLDERKTINRRHARECRGRLKKYVFDDPVAQKPMSELTRAASAVVRLGKFSGGVEALKSRGSSIEAEITVR